MRIGIGVALLGVAATFVACASRSPAMSSRFISIDTDGYGLEADGKSIGTDEFEQAVRDSIVAEIEKHRADTKATTAPLKLLLFIHGGMNGPKSDAERMERLVCPTSPCDPLKLFDTAHSSYYPIFINWNSGPLSSTADDLVRIRFGQSHPRLAPFTLPFVLFARLVSGIADVPVALSHIVVNMKESYQGAREQGDSAGCATFDAAAYTLLLPIYAITTPLLESFGTPAWNIMRRRADLAVASRLPRLDSSPASLNEGAARTLFRLLKIEVKAAQAGVSSKEMAASMQAARAPVSHPDSARSVEITVVAHSMGAMIANRLLAMALHDDDFPVTNVVYMAPAASIDETELAVAPFLATHPTTFWIFTLNRRDEAREIPAYGSVFFLPRGTLLAWIDTFFQPAADVSQATLGQIVNIDRQYGPDFSDLPPDRQVTRAGRGKNFEDGVEFGFHRRAFKQPTTPDKPSPFPWDQVKIFESARDLSTAGEIEGHGDFTKSRFLGEVLCNVDQSAFTDDFCKQTLSRLDPLPESSPRSFCGVRNPFHP